MTPPDHTLSILLRWRRLGQHIHVRVYIGTTPGTRPYVGKLTLRDAEWKAFQDMVKDTENVTIEESHTASDNPITEVRT